MMHPLDLIHGSQLNPILQYQVADMNIYDPIFSSAEIAKASGMSHVNFRAYLARETTGWRPVGPYALTAEKSGTGHRFSIYDAMGYALAAQLVAHGVDPKTSFDRAMHDFAHVGGDELQPDGTSLVRDPSDLYDVKHGRTFYVFNPGQSRGRCVAQRTITDVMSLLLPGGGQTAASAIVIDLNSLRRRVFDALGIEAAHG